MTVDHQRESATQNIARYAAGIKAAMAGLAMLSAPALADQSTTTEVSTGGKYELSEHQEKKVPTISEVNNLGSSARAALEALAALDEQYVRKIDNLISTHRSSYDVRRDWEDKRGPVRQKALESYEKYIEVYLAFVLANEKDGLKSTVEKRKKEASDMWARVSKVLEDFDRMAQPYR